MNQSKLIALLGIILVVVLTVSSTVYTVDERERVIVVRLGEVLRYDDVPGVHLKGAVPRHAALLIRAS